MKKTQKRIFGVLGLVAVVIMTIIAAIIPGPKASANSFTDELRVRVIGTTISAKFKKPSSNIVTTDSVIDYVFDYENADKVRFALSYTDKNNNTVDVPDFKDYNDLDYNPGTKSETLDILASGYGFGKFVSSLYATGPEGTELLYDSLSVEYVPVIASASQNDNDGLVHLAIDNYAGGVEKVEVYFEGKLVATINKGDFSSGAKIDLDDKDAGNYTFEVIAKDAGGNTLYKPYKVIFHYENVGIPNTNAPDTGLFFEGSNISKEDYLITGLIVFFIVGVVALGVVAKGSKR